MRTSLVLVLLLASSALLPGAAADADDALRPALDELNGVYMSEAWKDVNATLGTTIAGSPVPTLEGGPDETGVYKNPYSSPDHGHQTPAGTYLGYALDATVTLRTSSGETPDDGQNYLIEAWLQSAAGKVPARLAKTGAYTFQVIADLDGENRHGYPALTLGSQARLELEVYEVDDDPSQEPRLVASDAHDLEVHRGQASPTGTLFPEAQLPDWDDVGPTNYTELFQDVVPPDTRIDASFVFAGAAGQDAVVRLWRGTQPTEVAHRTTDENGTIEVSFTPGDALPANDDSGLLLLEASLEGGEGILGSKVLALPVSPHAMEVTSIKYEKRSGFGDSDNASTMQVVVEDPNEDPANNSRRGVLYIMKGTDVLGETSFAPTDTSNPGTRTARFPASTIKDPGYTSYGLAALFFDGQDDFYSLANAVRGVDATVSSEAVAPHEQATFSITVTNENDNYNGETDPGLVTTARMVVEGLPGAAEEVRDEVTVPEGETRVAEVPYTPGAPGTFDVTVNVTAGEIQVDMVETVLVQDGSGLLSDNSILPVPAAGVPGLVGAILAVAVTLRRLQKA